MGIVQKAVIAAAGLGTRMYPITKVIEKAMLPIGRRPAIDYIVRECAAAGVTRIAIVVRGGNEQVQRYYSRRDAPEEAGAAPEITFIEQPPDGRYGTGVPALLAREFVAGDSFYLLSSDDVLIEQGRDSSLAALAVAAGRGYAVMGYPMPAAAAERYGHLLTRAADGGLQLTTIVEKPPETFEGRGDALINISRYVFPGRFLDTLATVGVHEASGEVRITDGLVAAMQLGEIVHVHTSTGRYFDIGHVRGLAEAWQFVVTPEQ